MKKMITLLWALVLLLSLSVTASASETGLVEYRQKGFSFLPGYREGELHYPTDLFPELKNVMPGDVLHQQVKIVHKGSRQADIAVYIKAEGSDENADFIRQLQLEVEHKGGHILYQGESYDAATESGWQRLAVLAPGKSTTLDLTLTVPLELDNAYANTHGTVVWRFKAEEIPIDPTLPKTSDDSHVYLWSGALMISAAAAAMLLAAGKRKK